jgi:hypothetical protein
MTTPVKKTTAAAKKTAAKATTLRKAPAKKTGPVVTTLPNGRERIDHSNCDHPRDFEGRAACSADHRGDK